MHAVVMAAAVVLGVSATARAQCAGEWITTATGAPGTDTPVSALTMWDPDGDGPLAPAIVAGGTFTEAGGTAARCVAMFNGSAWVPMPGIASPSSSVVTQVTALATYQGTVYAAGTGFAAPLAAPLIRWTGTAWESVLGGPTGTIVAMTVAGDELIVAWGPTGSATQVGAWNGTSWRNLGPMFTRPVRSLTVWNGELVAGGEMLLFSPVELGGLARWDGSAWQPIPGINPASTPAVSSVCVHNGDLVVAGSFTTIGGVAANRIARYDGTNWHALGSGLPVKGSRLVSFNGSLYAGGAFTTAGGVAATGIARWDGAAWSGVGASLSSVFALLPAGNDLVVGGSFATETVSSIAARNVMRLSDGVWHSLGGADTTAGVIRRFGRFGGDLFAVLSRRDTPNASTTPMTLTKRVGNQWVPFEPTLKATSITVLDTGEPDLIIGGTFTAPPAIAGRGIARWNGTAWEPFAGGVSGTVYSATRFRGSLIVGGSFSAAGGVPAKGIAAWDGSVWKALGSGVTTSSGTVGSVYSLVALRGQLLVGGLFDVAGGVPALSFAQWNGVAWNAPALERQYFRYVFPMSDTEAVVQETDLSDYARALLWSGATMEGLPGYSRVQVAGGFPLYTFAESNRALCAHDQALFAGGYNSSVLYAPSPSFNAMPFKVLQRYDPVTNTWLQVDANFLGFPMPLSPYYQPGSTQPNAAIITALLSDGDTIHVGGQFVSVNGAASYGYAQYHLPRRPFFTMNPSGRGALPGGSVALAVAADGAGPIAYRWYKDAVALEDGPTGSGAVIAGSASAMLEISGVQHDDNGLYSCVASNACGSAESYAASVSTCAADYDHDGLNTPDDVGDFITDYYTSPAVAGPGGFAVVCAGNDPPYDAGYKAAFTSDFSGQCSAPTPDNLGDFVTAYFAGC